MNKINSHIAGLALGGTVGVVHAVWSLLVFLGWAQWLMDWAMGLHFVNLEYSIQPFSFGNALLLVLVTTVIGYAVGHVFGWLWNSAHRSSGK